MISLDSVCNMFIRDFNADSDVVMDRLGGTSYQTSKFAVWIVKYDLTDVWRWMHQDNKMFLCHLNTHSPLSRIYLALCIPLLLTIAETISLEVFLTMPPSFILLLLSSYRVTYLKIAT